jgi:hypothetical protein
VDFEIKPRVLNIKFQGESYTVRFPNVEESDHYLQELDKAEGEDIKLLMRRFLDKLGLPMEVSGKLEYDDIKAISKKFGEEKKH